MSLLRARSSFLLRNAPRWYSSTLKSASGHKLILQTDPQKDVLAQIELPNGRITRVEFARLPPYPSATEASIACILWDETKSAMLGGEFEWGVAPTPSRSNLYDIRPSPVAGYGMFATRDIQCGETILVERPMLMFPDGMEFTRGDIGPDADPASFVPSMSEFAIMTLDLLLATRLRESESADLYRLFSHDGSRLNITRRNMMIWKPPLPGFYQGWHRIICREASRINHACAPNVDTTYNKDSLTVSINAITSVARGDELFSAYECYDDYAPRAERQAQLARSYGFDCACPMCVLPAELSAQSDATRQVLLEELDHMSETLSLNDAGEPCDVEFDAWLADRALPDDHIVRHSERMLALIEAEGAGVFAHNAFHYLRLIRACVALADEEGSRYWAERLMQIHHPLFVQLREHAAGILAKDEEQLEEWGVRKKGPTE
ncbi:hypothetical protein C8R46DRAFT_1102012 [Mycena filopes]|nr:hypothetical protein C8R46DRAFT_1102012 [Mycena filopes]